MNKVSNSERFVFGRRGGRSEIASVEASKSISNIRKHEISKDVERGVFKSGTSQEINAYDKELTRNFGSRVSISTGIEREYELVKSGSIATTTSGTAWGGAGGTVRQGPEIYSPLWLTSNTHLPRDRGTMNAWARAFFALHPVVNNALSLHSTYPISKMNIVCSDKRVETFFGEMAEEMDLLNVCVEMAKEFYVIGEVFPLLDLDEGTMKWRRCIIQNPDYIFVKRTAVPSEPEISLKPDAELIRIITGNDAESKRIRASLPADIIKYVKGGKNIPLDNFYISHLARKISPYETRGTSIIASCFKALMLWDKLRECKYSQADNLINPITLVKLGGSADAEYRVTQGDLEAWRELLECHDEETEVLTDQGFKKFDEVIDFDETEETVIPCKPKDGIKIACFNPDNEELEYHVPERATLYNYDGDMYHFKNKKMDIKVTPNHRMWVRHNSKKTINGKRKVVWNNWEKIEAKNLSLNSYSKFRSKINWKGNDDIKTINVIGKEVPIELYLEFLGYLISEGHLVYSNYHWNVGVSQSINKYYRRMKQCMDQFAECVGLKYTEYMDPGSRRNVNFSDCWTARFNNKELFEHFKAEVQGSNGGVKSYDKKIPRWVLALSPRLLKILLQALVDGDGSVRNNEKGFLYFTTSKELCDDVYELVYKCGFAPNIHFKNRAGQVHTINNKNYIVRSIYIVMWADNIKGNFPLVYKTSIGKEHKNELLKIENYKGKVWCFTVPTGLFVTRRNGKITVQGNSAQYDKDFKIITHGSVTIERIGAQTVIDINPDLDKLIKEIYIGLMVPQVIMEGGDITYANGSLSLDVLRQRYMQFQNMLAKWIRTKVFAPICQLHDFWDYDGGDKKLIVPNIEWNHMNLFDMSDYINQLSQLVGEKKMVSVHTLYRSLGLDYEEEQRKIRQESVNDAIREKEAEILSKMSLTELRALDADKDIPDVPDKPVPGESPDEAPVAGEEAGAGGGLGGGMDMGGMGGMGGGGGAEAGGVPAPPATE